MFLSVTLILLIVTPVGPKRKPLSLTLGKNTGDRKSQSHFESSLSPVLLLSRDKQPGPSSLLLTQTPHQGLFRIFISRHDQAAEAATEAP